MPGDIAMEKEYNELTKRLVEEGYTAEHHPDYVFVNDCCQEKENPLRNYGGGFQYRKWYIDGKAFRTPCGIQCSGRSCMTSMYYNRVEWTFENDRATVRCPYRRSPCSLRDPFLPSDGVLKFFCSVHMTEEAYEYAGSLEELKDQHEKEIYNRKLQFSMQRHGRTCDYQMRYDEDRGEWMMHYDPDICAKLKCMGYCPILGKDLDHKKGNVFYDLKIKQRRKDLDGTLFEGQIDVSIQKGKKALDHPVSMDICRNYAKICKEKIHWKVKMAYHSERFRSERSGSHDFSVEVLNIRAERRESRDLIQDLIDISEGIQITHASDLDMVRKTERSEKRKQRQQKKILRLEEKLLKVGYANLPEYGCDRIHADQWLGEERIHELEQQRRMRMQEEQKKPVQLMFDLTENK